jgi:Uma2 family endonuclease
MFQGSVPSASDYTRPGNDLVISMINDDVSVMATNLQRRPITVDEYHRMLDAGILKDGERVELLRGDLVKKMTVKDPHRVCLLRLNELLVLRFAGRAVVQPRNPVVVLDDSEPEPDIALLAINEASVSGTRHAYPPDVFALIEVSDASRGRDIGFKRSLYAEGGIREYWVIDLVDNVIRINRDPNPATQTYATTAIARRGELIAFGAFPDDIIAVDEILAPRQ